MKFEKPNNRVTLVLGGELSSGGMLDYLLCWVNELLNTSCDIQIIANQEVFLLPEFQAISGRVFNTVELPFTGSKIKVRYMKYLFSAIYPIDNQSFISINNKIKSFSPDYIHVVDETILLPYLYPILNISRTPLIVTIHDFEYHDGQFRSFFAYLASKISRLFIKKFHITPHFHNNCLVPLDTYSIDRTVVHEHPLPKILFSKCIKTSSDVIQIGFMGRIEPYKGITKIPEILEIFEKKYQKQYSFLIAGRGAGLPLDEFKVLNGDIKIFNEFIPNEKFHKLMSNLDILILPYINATQSGVAYLAKAYGCHIIAYNVGALGEFVQDYKYGYLSEDFSSEKFADKLSEVSERING